MAGGPSPTVRRRRLGVELRKLRESAGLTCEEVGDRLEWSASKISRMETGRVRVHPRDVRDLLDLYGLRTGGNRDGLVELARESRRKGWWHSYGDVVPPWFEVYVGLEAEASSVLTYEMHVLPGLLQSEWYTREIFRATRPAETPGAEERRVELRMTRQERLTTVPALELHAVIDEAALRRQVGNLEVMIGQLERLMDTARLPNVTVQILPLAVGAHPGMEGPFTILGFPDDDDPDVAYLDYALGGLYLERETEVRGYTVIFDRLREVALSPGESMALLRRLVDGMTASAG